MLQSACERAVLAGKPIHMMVSSEGYPVEAFLTPGSASDTAEMQNFNFDLA